MLLPSTTVSTPCHSGSFHKALPTCTVSLAHAEVVCEMDKSQDVSCAPQLSVHRVKPIRAPYRLNQINLIPFPTAAPDSSFPSAISSRPLPLPPRTHALLRTRMTTDIATFRSRKISLSPPSKAGIVAPSMQRRRSRDPNVADRLVVELDDEDHHHHTLPQRPSSPSPEPREQATRGQHRKTESSSDIPKSPDQLAPPAYSTLPPPYSVTTGDKQDVNVVVEKENQEDLISKLLASQKPAHRTPPISISSPSSSASAPSTSYKRSGVSTSELRVLVYLYRTVVYGLELRNRKSLELGSSSCSSSASRPTSPAKKKPLGPRCSPSTSPTSRTASLIPPPEDKLRFESVLAAASAKAKGISRHTQGGFAQVPLVEDDLDSDQDAEATEYTTPRTPFHSPSQSPRSSPPPFLRHSPSLDAVASQFSSSTLKSKKEKMKSEIDAELHVQDALLALHLKEFLRAQGVCEEDLKVDFDEEGRVVEPEREEVEEEVKKDGQVEQEGDGEGSILDEYFMGIEEEEHSGPAKKDRGPIIEDDDVVTQPKLDSPFVEEDDLDMDIDNSSALTTPTPKPPTLQLATVAQRISSPPPPSPSPRPHAVLPTSYMVALLTMRNRHPSRKPASSSSSNGTQEKGKDSKVKRKSGLSVVVDLD